MKHFARNVAGRDFAVGDIHGCFSHLSRSLDAISFDSSADRLFSVGDLVDRGPESDQVLEWLDKPWFHAICGNHDFMAWRSALGIPYPEVDHRMHGGEWLDRISGSARGQLGRRLRALPLALEVETPSGLVGLVHAIARSMTGTRCSSPLVLGRVDQQAGRMLSVVDRAL